MLLAEPRGKLVQFIVPFPVSLWSYGSTMFYLIQIMAVFFLIFKLDSMAVFSPRSEKFRDTVALSFVCGKYSPTMD